MPNRRDFLKTVMVVGVGHWGKRSYSYPKKQGIDNTERPVGPTTTNIVWNRNIFCQFENEELKKAVEKCAIETDSSVFYGVSGDPDLFAIPSFINIIDRSMIGYDLWKENNEILDTCGCSYDPIFIVDDMKDLPLPQYKYVYQFDMDDRTTIPTIIETIKQMRTDSELRAKWQIL